MISQKKLKSIQYNPDPTRLRAHIERLGLTQAETAHLLRIDERTMRRYLQAPGTPGSVRMPFPHFAVITLANPAADR